MAPILVGCALGFADGVVDAVEAGEAESVIPAAPGMVVLVDVEVGLLELMVVLLGSKFRSW